MVKTRSGMITSKGNLLSLGMNLEYEKGKEEA